jgi:hypothetical protein
MIASNTSLNTDAPKSGARLAQAVRLHFSDGAGRDAKSFPLNT